MDALKSKVLIISALFVGIATFGGEARGARMSGTNPVLDARGGTLYIPVKPSTSGILGGGGTVGLVRDALAIGVGGNSEGSVTFLMEFDFAAMMGPGKWVNPLTARLLLGFRDLDFLPVTGSGVAYLEEVDLTFLSDSNDTPGSIDLTMDATNYHVYSGGAPFHKTNKVDVVYEILLGAQLGVTAAEFADMNDDFNFALLVTLRSQSVRFKPGPVLFNTPEDLENSFQFEILPEPGMLMLLTVGGAGVLLRKRRV